MAKYETYYTGEILNQYKYDNHQYLYGGPNSNMLVIQEGNPRTNGMTKAWVMVDRYRPNGQLFNAPYWTFKRFFQRKHPVIIYQADQEADNGEDLL